VTNNEFIYGRRPAFEALNSDTPLEKIILRFPAGGRIIGEIIDSAKKRGIRIDRLPANVFDKKYDAKVSGGVVVFLSAVKTLDLDELLKRIEDRKETPFLVILDGIEDPHNLGAIARSAEGAGCNGLIVSKHCSAPLNAVAVKTSAGTLLHLPVVKTVNLTSAIGVLKKAGIWIYGADISGKDFRTIQYSSPFALIIGAEDKGISRLVKSKCDDLISIPMKGKTSSLNASVSAGILLFHISQFI
jgi:23S rRNA (guanosine2251-2'-O)-methyltransferase